jgi:hypothetical protein
MKENKPAFESSLLRMAAVVAALSFAVVPLYAQYYINSACTGTTTTDTCKQDCSGDCDVTTTPKQNCTPSTTVCNALAYPRPGWTVTTTIQNGLCTAGTGGNNCDCENCGITYGTANQMCF